MAIYPFLSAWRRLFVLSHVCKKIEKNIVNREFLKKNFSFTTFFLNPLPKTI